MALVRMENEENWSWFLSGVVPLFPGLRARLTVIISDRQKGLQNVVTEHLSTAVHGHCCQHIADNITRKWSGYIKIFWKAARALTKPSFNSIMDKLAEDNKDCATYIRGIPVEKWARHAFPIRRWSHDTSNMSESINKAWLEARDLPAFDLLLWIWNWAMTTVYKRRTEKMTKSTRLTDYAYTYLEDERKRTGWYVVYPSNNRQASIQATTGFIRIVDLQERTCSCGDFQELLLPCRHAQQLCREICEGPRKEREYYVSECYTLDEYRETYQDSIPPIEPNIVEEDPTCKAPPRQKTAGRPKKQRIRHKVRPTKALHCSTCGRDGHNRRTCAHRPEAEPIDSVKSSESLEESENEEQEQEQEGEDGEDLPEFETLRETAELARRVQSQKAEAEAAREAKEERQAAEGLLDLMDVSGFTEGRERMNEAGPQLEPSLHQSSDSQSEDSQKETEEEARERRENDESLRRQEEEDEREDIERWQRLVMEQDPDEADLCHQMETSPNTLPRWSRSWRHIGGINTYILSPWQKRRGKKDVS